MRAHRDEYGIIALGLERLEVLDAGVCRDLDSRSRDVGDVLVDNLVGQTVRWQGQA